MFPSLLLPLLSLFTTSSSPASNTPAIHRRDANPAQSPQAVREALMQHIARRGAGSSEQVWELDERGLPITATTTMVVDMTTTQTVWVQETGQVVFPNPLSGSSSSSSSATGSASTSASSTSSTSFSADAPSASSSSSHTETASASPSPSVSDIVSSVTDASGPSSSTWPSGVQPTSTDSLSTDAATSTTSPSTSDSASVSAVTSSATPSSVSAEDTTSSFTSSSSASSETDTGRSTWRSNWPGASSSSTTSSTATETYARSTWRSDFPPSSASSTATESASTSSTDASSASATMSPASSSSDMSASAPASSATDMSASASASASASTTEIASTSAVSSSVAQPSSTGGPSSPLPNTIMCGYYADWSGWYLAPESIDWSLFDVVDFAFALPTADFGLEFTQWDSSDLLTRLVAGAHANGKRVKLSIGGWTGSTYFSTIMASSDNRATFIGNILTAYHSYNLDGIDIDWEYPGVQGAGSNAISSQDSANFLSFLQELRAALPAGALISNAVQVWPYADSNGNPMTDVSGFAAVIDYVLIMNYDVWGSSSNPGPNAPLSNACGNSTQPLANAYSAVASWTAAGMPANQITLGVPAYGYLQSSWATSLKQKRDIMHEPPHRRVAREERERQLGKRGVTAQADGGGDSGIVMFEELISQGILTQDGSGNWVGAGGFVNEWDQCSSTPWLKSDETGQIVTYDDPQSMSLKGQFAAQTGIRGCNVFSMDGDWTNGAFPLTSAVRSGLGI